MVAGVRGRWLSTVVLMVVAAAFAVVQTRSGTGADDVGGAVADALGQGGCFGGYPMFGARLLGRAAAAVGDGRVDQPRCGADSGTVVGFVPVF